MYVSLNSTLPGSRNVILIQNNSQGIEIDISTLTTSEKSIITKFINTVGKHISVNIENIETEIKEDVYFFIPQETSLETVTIDYNTLTATKKNNVNAFIEFLLNQLN
jgi:hypothetical protein